jgi:F-type H+-transporting ATPase subunit b
MSQRRLTRLFIPAFGMLLCMTVAFAPLSARAENESGDRDVIHGTPIPYEQEKKAAAPAPEAAKPAAGASGAAEDRIEPARKAERVAVSKKAPAEAEENVGFPQLNAKTYPSQVFWLFVSFVLLYALMSKIALPRVGEVLDTRRSHRENDLKRAEQLQEEATKVKAAYEAAIAKAQAEAQDAQRAAEQDASEKIAEKNAEFAEKARKRVAAAEQNIARAKEEALSSLADISADVAAEMANKVAGVQVGKAEARKAVNEVMQKEAA